MVKKYLRDNCDHSFDGLKENYLPKALDSVPIQIICHWEHWLLWDGSLSGRTWVSSGAVTGEKNQLQEVQIT